MSMVSEYVQKALEQARDMMPLTLEHLKTINSLSPDEYIELNRLVEKEELFPLIKEESTRTRLVHPHIAAASSSADNSSSSNNNSHGHARQSDFDVMFTGIAEHVRKELVGMNPFLNKEKMREIGREILSDPSLRGFRFSDDPIATIKIIATKTFISTFKDEKIVSKIMDSVLQTDMARKTILEESRKEAFNDLR